MASVGHLLPLGCPLHPRQFQCLRLAARGMTYKQIGLELGIQVSTVRTHLHKTYVALDVSGAPGAIAHACRHGWHDFQPGPPPPPKEEPRLSLGARLYLDGFNRVLAGDPSGREGMRLGRATIGWEIGHRLPRRSGARGSFGQLLTEIIEAA